MKVVQAIFLSFAGTSTYSNTVEIYVPFNCKFIHFKQLAYVAGTGTQNFVTLQSDLTDWQPLGTVARDNKVDNASIDILIEFQFPKRIAGNYTFTMTLDNNTSAAGTSGGDTVAIIAEFYDENSFPPQVKTEPSKFTDLPGSALGL